jgi:hypothetical protein
MAHLLLFPENSMKTLKPHKNHIPTQSFSKYSKFGPFSISDHLIEYLSSLKKESSKSSLFFFNEKLMILAWFPYTSRKPNPQFSEIGHFFNILAISSN